jgi:hypothetical protein
MRRKLRYKRIRRRARNPFGDITNLAVGAAGAGIAVGLGGKMVDMFK